MEFDHRLLSQPVSRPTRRSDIPAILEITRHTWNGLEYVPRMLEQWLLDTSGWMFTAEISGNPVGMIKLSILTDDQWWIEGLRVNQLIKNRGIGKHLFNYAINFWKQQLSGTLQMLTGEMNSTSLHLADVAGFQLKQKLTLFSALPINTDPSILALSQVDEIQAIGQQTSAFDTHLSLPQYLDSGWRFNSYDTQTVLKAIQLSHLWKASNPNGYVIMDEHPEGEPNQGVIQAILCQPEELERFLMESRKIAHLQGWQKIQ